MLIGCCAACCASSARCAVSSLAHRDESDGDKEDTPDEEEAIESDGETFPDEEEDDEEEEVERIDCALAGLAAGCLFARWPAAARRAAGLALAADELVTGADAAAALWRWLSCFEAFEAAPFAAFALPVCCSADCFARFDSLLPAPGWRLFAAPLDFGPAVEAAAAVALIAAISGDSPSEQLAIGCGWLSNNICIWFLSSNELVELTPPVANVELSISCCCAAAKPLTTWRRWPSCWNWPCWPSAAELFADVVVA